MDKYAFHNDEGHKIEDCSFLKDAIEEAVRNSKLKDFVAQDANQQGKNSGGETKVRQTYK
ncbi:hypothetical protein J1N35_000026 [Gossypium stocksii]|uniref:Uncharacterized protein n=1 Tax=Gossypium stocksii TaxID=47602 RepID=A0A9D3WHM0_9ROSI|nr:hypothetical protein J1N35_000026 [Gossypium stocksii]